MEQQDELKELAEALLKAIEANTEYNDVSQPIVRLQYIADEINDLQNYLLFIDGIIDDKIRHDIVNKYK